MHRPLSSLPQKSPDAAASMIYLIVALLLLLVPSVLRAEALNQSCAGKGQPWSDARFGSVKAVYLDNYCGYCHSFSVVESRGMFGPNHDAAAAVAARYIDDPGYTGGAAGAQEYLAESIAQPTVYMTPGYAATTHQMPAYEGLLTEAQISELAAFLTAYGDC